MFRREPFRAMDVVRGVAALLSDLGADVASEE